MVSSGYGIELTVEKVWDTAWDTDRFNLINVSLGTKFNFWITDDSATDITDSKIVKLLEVESNDVFAYWNAVSKIERLAEPWDFLQVWLKDHLQGDQFLRYFRETIEKCKKILGMNKMELFKSDLPSSTSDW